MERRTDDVNLYDDAVIRDPWPHYARLRAKGPVVWMQALGNFAFTRYDSVRAGLRDHASFVSGLGTAADDFGCQHQRGNTVASDPPRHTTLREAVIAPLGADKITQLRPRIQAVADEIVSTCLAKAEIDGIRDLAQPMPLAIVRDLVGLPEFGRENMLRWASAAFRHAGHPERQRPRCAGHHRRDARVYPRRCHARQA